MIFKSEPHDRFFPMMKWQNEFLLGQKDVSGRFASRGRSRRLHPIKQNRRAMMLMKRTRKRLARFLPRHGRLMVR